MNAQIIYATMTGHSKKIAEKIAQETAITAQNIKDNPKVPSCGLLIIVSGIYSGECSPELIEFAKSLSPDEIKKVVLISSSTKGGTQGSLRKTLTDAGIAVETEEYICKGNFLFMAMGHPNRAEIDQAVTFAKKMIG